MLVLAVLAPCGGCGKVGSRLYQVDGKLFVGEEPAANASLAFHPTGDAREKYLLPVGMTGPDGSYHLTTFAKDDGAPAGDYVVTVIWPDVTQPYDECEHVNLAEHDRLHGQYADPKKSPIRAHVPARSSEIRLEASVRSKAAADAPTQSN